MFSQFQKLLRYDFFHLQKNVNDITEEVKNICSVLGCVETKQITDAVNELNQILQRKVEVNTLIY